MKNDNEPLVSVVIPIFNEGPYIRATLQSLAAQNYNSLELILVDDGSDDDSVDIVTEYLEGRSMDYTVLTNPTNMGQTFARNRGVMHVSGRYVIFHDADDVSTPDRLRKQVQYLEEHPEVGVVGGGFFYINPNRDQQGIRLRPTDDDSIRSGMARESMINLGTAMFRREALLNAQIFTSSNVEGYELIVNVARSWKLANLSEPIYLYRINEGSRSQQNQLKKKLTLAYRSYQAIQKLELPKWQLLLQFGWLIYMNSPNKVQELIHRLFSRTEERDLTSDEKQTLEILQQYG